MVFLLRLEERIDLKIVLYKKLMQLILVMVDFLTSVNFYNPPVIWSVIFILKIWHYFNFVLDLVCGRYWVSSPKSYESRGECQH
jgi:uncharacterized Fe-S cluster-containing MiaB family protein